MTTQDFIKLLQESRSEVKKYALWKDFISGTPLENDIPVLMAEFARDYAEQRLKNYDDLRADMAKLRDTLGAIRRANCGQYGEVSDAGIEAILDGAKAP
jgi:hypothetical protein